MSIAYLVGTPLSNPSAWSDTSGGASGSFTGGTDGLPDADTDVIIDANSIDAVADLATKVKSITHSAAGIDITQTSNFDTDAFTITAGTWTTGAFGFNCTNAFTKAGTGVFNGSLATFFLIGSLSLSGSGLFSGSPSLPTVDVDEDVLPTTIVEAILNTAINPLRAKDDMGEVEMHNLKDLIAAEKHTANKTALAGGIGGMLKQMKPTSAL